MRRPARYLPISDYGFIGDCRSSALVSRLGSIDWCCMPRFDVGSSFGRLRDADRGGHCSITPTGSATVNRSYLEDTLVLVSTVRTDTGEATLTDCFTVSEDPARRPQLLRVVEGVRGHVGFAVEVVPRFDYGEVAAWITQCGPDVRTAVGGDDALVISGDMDLDQPDPNSLVADVHVRAGERARLSSSPRTPRTWTPFPTRCPPSRSSIGGSTTRSSGGGAGRHGSPSPVRTPRRCAARLRC